MLIIEGADNVGKTTLAKHLVKRLNEREMPVVYRHFSRLPPCWDYYRDYLPHISRFAVMDRFWMSELAYAHARGEGSRLEAHRIALLEGHLLQEGSLTVVVTADDEVIRAGWGSKEEMYPVEVALRANAFFREKFVDKRETRCDEATYHLGKHNVVYPSSNEMFVDQIVDEYLTKQTMITLLGTQQKKW